MRFVPLLVLALLAVGCSGTRGTLSAGPGPQLPVAPKKQSLLRLPPLDKGEAVRGERSARGRWLRSLRAAARSGSDWVFPNPSRSTLQRRLERQARAHHFRVVSLEMQHPRQLAPVIVVRTAHPLSLAHATLSVLQGLDPNWGRGEPSELYEGLYFAAVDSSGVPLFSASEVVRGGYEGQSWARSKALDPVPNS
jgi:hypothetical protein